MDNGHGNVIEMQWNVEKKVNNYFRSHLFSLVHVIKYLIIKSTLIS